MTEDQTRTLREFADQVAKGLAVADVDQAARRRVFEAVNLTATLTIEDGQQVVYRRCIFGETNGGTLLSGNTRIVRQQSTRFALTARFVLSD